MGRWTEQQETSQQRERQSQTSPEQVIEFLTYLAEVRQANVTGATYRAYAKVLSQSRLMDLQKAIGNLAMRERRDGETAFPALATIVAEVRAASKNRLENRALKETENWYADRMAHPENWVRLKDCETAVRERMAARGGVGEAMSETVMSDGIAMRICEACALDRCADCQLIDCDCGCNYEECGHNWDMSWPPCRKCGGCPECGDCDCDMDAGDDFLEDEGA